MTRPDTRRLRNAQPALAARATLLIAVLVPALATGLLAGHWTPVGGAALAVGVLGSGAVAAVAWAYVAPMVLQALVLHGAPHAEVPRERFAAALAIRRPEEPGRPGRARPRAPGAGHAPRPAR